MSNVLQKPRRSLLREAFLLLVLMIPVMVNAQDITVSGTVTSDGSPLPGVYVLVKGTSTGTVSDTNGKYVIAAPPQSVLVFTFIGMRNTEVAVNNQSSIDVGMEADISQLDEVVVVGYGTQKKSDLTGSVASVSTKEIKSQPLLSLSQALQGRAPGVQVRQSSNAPGGGVSIRIRGGGSLQAGNEPLYVIDGYPLYNEAGPNLNPNDIETIDILKDASATAIYGSRGANGVVIITTKRGKEGRMNIDFEGYYGVQKVRKKLDLLNATELATLINEGIANVNEDNVGKPGFPKAPAFTEEQIAQLGKGTDWQDEIFRTAPMQSYQLTLSGGDDKMQYAVSGNIFDQKGIVINSDYNRSSLRINLDRKINSKLKFGNSLTLSRTVTNGVATDGDGGSGAGVVYGALNFSPTVPVRNPDGTYTLENRLGAIKINNPVALANDRVDKTTATRILGNLTAEYEIVKGLTFKVLLGTNMNLSKNRNYSPNSTYAGSQSGGVGAIYSSQYIDLLNENTLNYQFAVSEKHHFNVLAGYTIQKANFDDVRASAQNFGNDILQDNNLGAAQTTNTSGSNVWQWGLRSYIGRVNYDYDGKYLATITGRVDGSSKFGQGNKNSFFPSGSLAWRVSKESFMENVPQVSDLKLRVSYGFSGNQEIGTFQSLGALAAFNYSFGNTLLIGYGPNRISNPDLKWETTGQFDVGIDIGLFTNRVVLTADYYHKKTSDLLYSVPLPITTGYTNSLQNLGEVENKGFEIGLNTVNFDGDFQWTSNFNFATNKNKILNLGQFTADIPAGGASGHLQLSNSGILRIGEQIGVFYGLESDGIFQTAEEVAASAQKNAKPGDRRYIDHNPDGVINASDRKILGYAQPKFTFGFNNTFTYKGFELTVFFQGVHGNSIFNLNRFELESMTGVSNQSRDVLDRWTKTNPSNTIPRAKSEGTPYQVTSRQIEDGSYIRMKNIQLAYNFPSAVLSRFKINTAKVYVSAQNQITITDYSGYDPEVSRYGQETLSQGTDYGSYPAAKSVMFGVNLGF
ncbi:SusC/RagA family TonB-linked outer membrane protein [Pseudochryseolinea flava]|uniref:SusC/RagA family TonB-linked outer membrane protein n=1 Tax=Pseudochryseolinea flava TaxID=2059302 RepID=A0A364Y283_9BACT|nr:TonB-dependent receptor [Pseudochryseolinea flava]RAW00880.1 SusC/RagA family TonB-linked outer membrane protein [Pseudochryseolinea flava]